MALEKRTFEKGMNQDLAESLLEAGMYRYALNIRNGNSERGSVGIITDAEGNRVIGAQSLPSGENTVIGAIDDEANFRVIFIVYNDEGDNRIFAFNYKFNEYQTILADVNNTLNLNPNFLVTSINVIDANDTTYLLFTDNYGEPKNIDINQGLRTYDTIQTGGAFKYKKFFGNYDSVAPSNVREGDVYSRNIFITAENGSPAPVVMFYRAVTSNSTAPTTSTSVFTPNSGWEICPAGYIYGNLTEESFTNIVKPHLYQPVANYTSTGSDYNFIADSLFQFKVKYVRADGRESSWSPVSTFLTSVSQLDSLINITTYSNGNKINNAVRLFVDVPDASIYKTIKIAVRRVLNDKTPEDWKLAKSINLNDINNYVYTTRLQTVYVYDASEATMPLDTNDTTQLMSWVPPKAKAQSITSRNRVLYANFTEGKPYSLDGENSINENPPSVLFFEKDNPYNTLSDTIDLFYYNGTTVGLAVTEEINFAPEIFFPNGIAFRFPSTIKVGTEYTVGLTIDYYISAGGGSNYSTLSTAKTTTVSVVAVTSSVSGLLNSFVDTINNSKDLYLINEGREVFGLFLATAASAAFGGSNYLLVQPSPDNVGFVWTTNVRMKVVPTAKVGTSNLTTQTFKRGSQQKFAIAYSDKYGRLTTAIEHDGFSAYNPWWRDKSYDSATAQSIAGLYFADIGQRYAQIDLSHDAPEWATHYHILKTNSNGIERFVSFPLSRVIGLPKLSNGNTNPLDGVYFYRGFLRNDYRAIDSAISLTATSISDMELIYIPLNSLQNSTVGYTSFNNTPLAYDYVPGDRIRFCYYLTSTAPYAPTVSGQYFEAEADAEIVFYDSEINAIAIRPNDLPSNLVGANGIFDKTNSAGTAVFEGATAIRGMLCEIYTPEKEKAPEFYYEMYTGTISADTANSRYYHVGNVQTQNSAQSAIIELTNGDCFLKPRTYMWRSVLTALSDTAQTQVFNYVLEEANYFDKVPSKTWGAGRPNRSIRSTSQQEDITGFLGEVTRPTTIRFSEPLLPEQGFNGLGTIYDLNFKDANGALRAIQHMHTDGSKTFIFHENDTGYVESDRAVTTTLDGSNITIGANTPVSDVVYYGIAAGIGTHPESFAANNYRKYFVDANRGQVCRISQDGITPISEQGMNKYFKRVFREMINSPETSRAFGAYDKRTDEYTITLQWNTELSGAASTSISYASATSRLTFTVADTSLYDIYVGQYIKLVVPRQQNFDGSVQWGGIDDLFAIQAITSTTITLQIPLRPQYASIRNQLNIFFGGVEDPSKPVDAVASIFPPTAQTITYNERLKAWTSFHSFKAEFLCSAGMEFVSFRGGNLYMHDDYNNPHSYYGVDYPAYIDIISNMGGDQVKIWKTAALKVTTDDDIVNEADFVVAIDAVDTTGAPEPISGGVEDSRGKISTGKNFVYKEGQLYTAYMRTGTGTSYANFIEGDKLRGYWLYTRFKIKSGTNKIYKIISATFDFLMSNYTR